MLQPVISVAAIAARSAIRYCAPGIQVAVGSAVAYAAGVSVVVIADVGYKGIQRLLGREVTGFIPPRAAAAMPPVTPPPATKHTKAAKPTIAAELAPVI